MRSVKNGSIRISYRSLRFLAVIYLALPVLIFLAGFLKWYVALPGVCAVCIGLYQVLIPREPGINTGKSIMLSWWSIAGVFALILLWTQLGGMNGYLYQAEDWAARNAVFRDLITHSWPVTYQNGHSALVYYIGHWLPAALAGKLAGCIFQTEKAIWFCSRMALWLWSSFGMTILVLMVFLYVNAENHRKRITVLLTMILFSGMDIIGNILVGNLDHTFSPEVLHLEWWAPNKYQFTSITTCLYWVFNQAIIPWIVTMLVLMDKDAKHYLLYIASCMVCAPMPAVGLCILMAGKAVEGLKKTEKLTGWLKKILSVSNILVLVTIIPVMAAYLLCSNATGKIGAGPVTDGTDSSIVLLIKFLAFFILEIGTVLLLLWPGNRKNILFYIAGISLMIIPAIRIGHGTDFCMRGSIPALFLIMVYSADYLINTDWKVKEKVLPLKHAPARRTVSVLLILVLLIGAMTPAMEFYRGIYHVVSERKLSLPCDTTYSFENDADNETFTCKEYEKQWFYKLFAK